MKRSLLFLTALLISLVASAQNWGGGIDQRRYNFGFTFQYVSAEMKILKAANWQAAFSDPEQPSIQITDPLASISSAPSPGFGVGFVYNYRLLENLDIRLTPTLIFNDRNVQYVYQQPTQINMEQSVILKSIQSTMAEFPLGIKLKSDRKKNVRAYILAGAKYSLDIASKKRTDDEDKAPLAKFLKSKRNFLSYEGGLGMDIYFENFKLSPELKLSYSFRDVMLREQTAFSTPIDKLLLRQFTFSLFIE